MLKLLKLIITSLTFICCLCIVTGVPTSLFIYLFSGISQIYIRTIILAVLTALPVFFVLFAQKESWVFNMTYICAALIYATGWFIPIRADHYTQDDGWLIFFYPPTWLFLQFVYMYIALYFRRNFLKKEIEK